MDTRKRSGRHKRLETIRGERRKLKQRQRLVTLLILGGGVLLVVAVIIILALGSNKQPSLTSTPIPITPLTRPQVDGLLAMGNPEAPVKIEVWEDFQCSSCVRYTFDVEHKLIETYIADGTVYYVFHHYPFFDRSVGGKESTQSANASMCANEQDRFWDYHDMLYTNWNGVGKGAFSDDKLISFAENLGLDMKAFNSCFKANTYKAQIENDFQAGNAAGVHGTPTVFVNNKEVTPGYVPSYEQMVEAIEEALALR